MVEIIDGDKESFVVSIERFTRDGEKFATISLSKITYPDILILDVITADSLQLRHSYCDTEEIIDKAYYQALYVANSKISNAGLLETIVKRAVNELHACPYCNSDNISASDEDYSPNHIVREISCGNCGKQWDETYMCIGVDMR